MSWSKRVEPSMSVNRSVTVPEGSVGISVTIRRARLVAKRAEPTQVDAGRFERDGFAWGSSTA